MESSVRRFGREILKLMAQLYWIKTAKENWNKSRHGYRLAKILMTLLWELNSCIRVSGRSHKLILAIETAVSSAY